MSVDQNSHPQRQAIFTRQLNLAFITKDYFLNPPICVHQFAIYNCRFEPKRVYFNSKCIIRVRQSVH